VGARTGGHSPLSRRLLQHGGDRKDASAALEQGKFDLIAIGRLFIANPDLVQRIRGGSDVCFDRVSGNLFDFRISAILFREIPCFGA